MNEEEIIKNIKEMIQWSDHNTYKIALQGLLDLYNKEIQRNKDLEQILELTSKSLDNISYDQIPIAIEELKFKLQDLEQIEKEHKEENGRLRDKIKELEKEIIYWKEQAEGYQGLAEQIKEDFENRDRWE